MNCLAHISIFVLLVVDYIFNQIKFIKAHLILVLLVDIGYLITNVVATFVRKTPVYPPLKYTDIYSYLILLGCLVFNLAGFFIGVLIDVKCKRY